MNFLRLSAAMLLVMCVAASATALRSPNGNLTVMIEVATGPQHVSDLQYSVTFNGTAVIAPSGLGLKIGDDLLGPRMKLIATRRGSNDTTWHPVCGERAVVRDHYNELALDLEQLDLPHRLFTVTFRAYDEGVAFCYTIPAQAQSGPIIITGETSEFRFEKNYPAWVTYSAQGHYQKMPLSAIKPGCERPLVVELGENLFAAIAEANLVDYARMKFASLTRGTGIVSKLDGSVKAALPLTTPWRVIMVAESPGRLIENNDIISNLNAPCAITDTSWIKPGRVIREVTLTTAGGKACVNFAVEHGLQYVEYDAGWYGDEYSAASDATGVHLDPKRSKGPLDLQEVIRYGKERGIGVLLYVNHLALERQIDQLLPLYKQWGVKGIKFGFVNVGSQQWTSWLHEAIRKCATNGFMVDVHDEYRPTGYGRTYPNLMTCEGIRGDETSPTNGVTLAHLFTRLLAGPADNTVCYYDKRVDANASHAYQLAKPVCIFSPWQFLFWYDRPSPAPKEGTGGVPSQARMGAEPELEFYKYLPTTWDDTKVLHGKIGEYAVVARRKGEQWFVGFLNSGAPRTFQVPLNFLKLDKTYRAWIYSDDQAIATRTHVRIDQQAVDAHTVLGLTAGKAGGVAVRIEPR